MGKYDNILNQEFYDKNPEIVAKALLGKYIVRKLGTVLLVGKIVETEAYLSLDDQAAHGFTGKSNRNKSLYKTAGHAYVHSMRQWFLLDIVTEKEDTPSSVLIRGIEPVEGIETMKKLRKTENLNNLTNGPSKFCQAFNINKDLDGIDVTSPASLVFISDSPTHIPDNEISVSHRIGISKSVDMPLRFWIKDNSFVS